MRNGLSRLSFGVLWEEKSSRLASLMTIEDGNDGGGGCHKVLKVEGSWKERGEKFSQNISEKWLRKLRPVSQTSLPPHESKSQAAELCKNSQILQLSRSEGGEHNAGANFN